MFQGTMTIQEAEPAVLRKAPSIGGLCRDCSKADTCTFPRDPSHPIRSCDEFEELAFPSTASSVARPVRSLVREDTDEPMELKGLCKECALRFTCVYPKPLGGVWHCDELA